MQARKTKIAMEQERIKQAMSILVVGGGAVGVEVMGELVDTFSEKNAVGETIQLRKRLGLITREPTLLPYFTQKAS